LPHALLPAATEILAFDTFIANPDRTVANPNCLFNGRELAIFDHELAFFMDGIIGWKPPWEPGAVRFPKGLPPRTRHVFLEEVRGLALDFSRLAGAFESITDKRVVEYRRALPKGWIGDGVAVGRMLGYIVELRSRIGEAINQLRGALQ
jgi:hypothetical protein